MRYEKILKREDGTRYRIITDFSTNRSGEKWSFFVHKCEPKKRTWNGVCDIDSYIYRALSLECRRAFELSAYLNHVSADEILDAHMELWQQMKPSLNLTVN